MAHDVFISYSSKDKEVADKICVAMESQGIVCWIAPRDILHGKSWSEAIADGIDGARVMVLVFSDKANKSNYIVNEVARAFNKGLKIISFKIEEFILSKSLDFFISTLQWLDATKPPFDQHIDELARSIHMHLATLNKGNNNKPKTPIPLQSIKQEIPHQEMPQEAMVQMDEARQETPHPTDINKSPAVIIACAVLAVLIAALSGTAWMNFKNNSAVAPSNPQFSTTTKSSSNDLPVHNGAAPNNLTEPSPLAVSNIRSFANSLGMRFLEIQPNKFMMGSPQTEEGRYGDEMLHQVSITRPYYLAEYEVTRGQFAAFVNETRYVTDAEKDGWAYGLQAGKWEKVNGINWRRAGFPQNDQHPVVCVSWNDAVAFCAWLNKKENRIYRLPTEAEWENACRAGTQTAYTWGNVPAQGEGWVNYADLSITKIVSDWTTYPWNDGFVYTAPVGSFRYNPWNLHDMLGNVFEWCSDGYADYDKGPAIDPTGNPQAKLRVVRGGAWSSDLRSGRCAFRSRRTPERRDANLGFRVCTSNGL